MNYWLRLYTSILDDPKVHRLSPEVFKGWVFLLCVAKENDGALPSIFDIAFRLRISETEANSLIQTLKRSGFIDEDGGQLWPHNWDKRQYQDTTAAERARRYRDARRDGQRDAYRDDAVTPPVSPPTPPSTENRDRDRAEQSARDAQPPARAKRASARRPVQCDEEWLTEQQANPAYAQLDVKACYHKMVAWCRNKGKEPTRGRLLNWLNREDKPMARPVLRIEQRATEPVIAADFDMDAWIDDLIANDWIPQLENERAGIEERGGPRLEWERRVIAYFSKPAAEGAA